MAGTEARCVQIRILSKCTGNSADKLEKDIARPRYFDPHDAITYGIIDKVVTNAP